MGAKGNAASGKKGGNPQEAEEDASERVTALMKQMFEIQMVDIEKKVDRLQKRKAELREMTEKLEQAIAEHQKESGALIEETKARLELKEEEKLRKRQHVATLEKEARELKKNLEDGVEERKKGFEEMVEELTKQLEKMEEDHKVLEDFKTNKGEYMRGLEEEERGREEAERQHQRNLFAILQKLEKAKFRLKKGAESRLLLLSLQFQEASRIKIGPPIHRMLQENRAIENELKSIKTAIWEYQVGYESSKEGVKHIKHRERLMVEEKDKFVARCIIQRNIIKALERKYEDVAETLKKYLPFQLENEALVRKYRILESQVDRKKAEVAEIGRLLSMKKDEASRMSEVSAFVRKTTRKLQILLRNAMRGAEEALVIQVIPMGETEEERYLSAETKLKLYQKRRDMAFKKKGKILKNLQEIIIRAQVSEDDWRLLSPDSVSFDHLDFVALFALPSQGDIVQEEMPVDGGTESKESLGPSGSDVSLPRSIGPEDAKGTEPVEEDEEEEEEEESEGSVLERVIKPMELEEEEVEWGGEGGGYILPEEMDEEEDEDDTDEDI